MKQFPTLLKTKNGTLHNVCYWYKNLHMSDMFEHAKSTSRKIHKKQVTMLASRMENKVVGVGRRERDTSHFLDFPIFWVNIINVSSIHRYK